jgi:RND family efflux transporter MFP subunit
MKKNVNSAIQLTFLSLLIFLSACTEKRQKYNVSTTNITESIYSSVTLEPAFLYSVYSEIQGRVLEFKKETGDSVAFGDVICTIDAVGAIKNSENAALNLELIQNKLFGGSSVIEDLTHEISMAQEQYSFDSIQYERFSTLNDKNISTDTEVEQAKLKMRSSKTRLDGLITQRKRLKKELGIQQKQAKNAYVSALSTSSGSTVTSIVDGVVYEIFKENGELVNMQQPVAMIGSTDDFIIRMLVDEIDITQVEIGQKVNINLEAYPDTTFLAKIDQIYPKMDAMTQSFQVIAKFIDPPKKLYLGLTGEANIIVKEADDVVVIPREYLIEGNFVETPSEKKQVEIGLISLSHVEITSGLSKGDKIYLPVE